ncbi:MAG TPA: ribonuclease H-like domain-containing protein [Polyangiaceae bacterium]|nr:ribonuclease H-like domain-containing protein [Polyangiaceae bacterium]
MLLSTFQLGPGLGPAREKAFWKLGMTRWEDVATWQREVKGQQGAFQALRRAIEEATAAFDARDVSRLADLLPSGEHWRLFEAFGGDAAYLDIETSDDVVGFAGISAIGVLDRHGPHLLLAGRDLERFPELAREWSMLVTFNGLTFDVPILRRAFPDWEPPRAHVDLRHVLGRLGHRGALKQLEERLGLHLERPEHLRPLNDTGASALFRRGREGDREALRRFAEYNLYDAVGLRTLMAFAYNGRLEGLASRWPALRATTRPLAVPGRGDVLYDVSKILLSL